MKLILVPRVAFVFDDVVAVCTGFLWIQRIFVVDRLIRRVNDSIVQADRCRTEEDVRSPVQLESDLGCVSFIKEHTEIQRMQIFAAARML